MRTTRCAAAIAGLIASLVAVGSAPASAVEGSAGTPGFCPGDEGVTVVVDFTALGGDVVVRCAPGSGERTGFEALQDAGFDVTGTTRFGQGAVCRIEGRPAADEELAVEGDAGYREACVDMPPSAAYWSYWSADNGGDWSYSQYGVQNRDAIDGGFEGWSFALNATSAEPPEPRIAPERPESSSDAPESDDSDDVDAEESGRTGDTGGQTEPEDGGDDARQGEQIAKGLPKPMKRDTGPAPTSGTQNGVEWSGGEETSNEAASSTSGEADSGIVPWVAGGVLGVLAVLIGVTAVRRRASRDATSS